MSRRIAKYDIMSAACTPLRRNCDTALAIEIRCGKRALDGHAPEHLFLGRAVGFLHHVFCRLPIALATAITAEQHFQRTLCNHLTAEFSRRRTEIEDVIRAFNHFPVMFYNDDRISEITQLLERFNQTCVVALMQSDRRFVKNVEHTDELRPDLRGETNALGLAAGERAGCTIERQIIQPDIRKKTKP